MVEGLFCLNLVSFVAFCHCKNMMKLFSPSKQLLIDFGGCLLGVHSDYNSFLNFLKLPAACHSMNGNDKDILNSKFCCKIWLRYFKKFRF